MLQGREEGWNEPVLLGKKKKLKFPSAGFGWLLKLPAARLGFKGHIFANQCLHHALSGERRRWGLWGKINAASWLS